MSDPIRSKHRNESWWKRRTKCEKVLTGILSVAIVGIITLIIVLINKLPAIRAGSRDICTTKGCVKSAAKALQKMNPSADPCDDFYEFACGKFIETQHIPEDRVWVTSSNEIGDEISRKYRTVIEKPIQKSDLKSFALAKKLYKICMNTTNIENDNLKTMKRYLKEMGGWPLLEGSYWNENSFEWKDTLFRLRRKGFNHGMLISAYVDVDAKNSTKRIFSIGQPCGGFAKLLKKGMNETVVQAYYDYMVDIAIIFGADKIQASKEMMEVLEFEMELAKIVIPSEERRNASLEYNPMTIREVQLKFPSIPWLQFINMKLEPYVTLSYEDTVIVTLPAYITKLEKVLGRTPKRVLANHIFWTTVKYKTFYFNQEVYNKDLQFSKIAYGTTSISPRWELCVGSVQNLYIATGSMYVRRYFKGTSKNVVSELVSDIRDTFFDTLKKSTWMDSKTKRKAQLKAEEMDAYIGYPNEILDDKLIEEYYENLEFYNENFLETSLVMNIFFRNKSLKKYYEPYDKKDWKNKAFPTTVNAFYNQFENSIQIPTGILQGTFFSKDRPHYMNYGAIGYVIGHEIIHGFDDEGRQFDKDGNLMDWWEPSTNKTFQEKAQCIIDQYTNHTMDKINMTLNGVNTQGENIADNGGIKIAYLGYQKWLERNHPEQRLPGLPYSPQQMFWISAAHNWCGKSRPEIEKLMILNDYHSPHYYRTIIPFLNSGYFAKDYNCPLGSKMNPKHKCRVW